MTRLPLLALSVPPLLLPLAQGFQEGSGPCTAKEPFTEGVASQRGPGRRVACVQVQAASAVQGPSPPSPPRPPIHRWESRGSWKAVIVQCHTTRGLGLLSPGQVSPATPSPAPSVLKEPAPTRGENKGSCAFVLPLGQVHRETHGVLSGPMRQVSL